MENRTTGRASSAASHIDPSDPGTGTGSIQTGTGTGTGLRTKSGQTRLDVTSLSFTNLVAPGDAPDLGEVRGWRLQRQLLVTMVAPVIAIVGLLGFLSALSSAQQFEKTGRAFTERFQEQARELGGTVAHTLSLTSASSFRDNNYALLGEIVKAIVADNPNVLRVRMYDSASTLVADSDDGEQEKIEGQANPLIERSRVTSTYKGRPVFEYQEPIDYGSKSEKGLVMVSYSLEQLQTQLASLEAAKQSAMRSITLRTIAFGLGFVLLAVLLAAFQGRRITRPLDELSSTAMMLAQGELGTRVGADAGGSREVQTLAAVFNFMADRIVNLLGNARAKAVLEREMQLARQVQETLLPPRDALAFGPLRIAGACLTADACGGDWWLRSAIDERRVVVGIGDVTGHGLSTALVATSATSGFAAAMKLSRPEQINAEMLMDSLNQTLVHIGKGAYQMSCALAVIDIKSGEIEFASGGHPSACVYNRFDHSVSTLQARGALLGSTASSKYTSRRSQLRPGDVIVWYTDGLTEGRDAEGRIYGFQRLSRRLTECGNLPAEGIRDALLADAQAYSGGKAQLDDITTFVAEYAPNTHAPHP